MKMNRWLQLVGVLQGVALWVLWTAWQHYVWPAVDPLSERALLYISLALPLAFYLTQNIETLTRKRRIRILIGVTSLFVLLGAYSGWVDNAKTDLYGELLRTSPARASDLFAAAVLGFIIVPLWAHYDSAAKRWPYHALFETAWRNAMLIISSFALTGVFWMVLFAGAMLMNSIGLNFIFDLIKTPSFSIPVNGLIFGTAFALGLARAEMIITLRRFWLTISAWLLPLLLLFSVMWVVALPFTGLDLLFKTHNAGFILLWFLALSVKFANAAYQDGSGEQPYSQQLGHWLEYAWLSLLGLVAVAWWAMQLRVAQYGWTEDRVWGVFVLLLVTLYTLGYAYSVRFKHGWLANIGKTNVFTALLMCAGLVLLLSPLADARRIAVNSQMSRVMNHGVDAEKIDYTYLRWEAGRYGTDALKKLAEGIEHKDRETIAAKAKLILALKQRYGSTAVEKLTDAQVRERFRVLPKEEVLDEALIKLMQSSTSWQQTQCLQANMQCLAWMIDLNGDGLKEAVIIQKLPQGYFGNVIFYHHVAKDQYKYGGTLSNFYDADKTVQEKMMQDIERGNVKTLAPRFNDIMIGGKRISVVADPCRKDCTE